MITDDDENDVDNYDDDEFSSQWFSHSTTKKEAHLYHELSIMIID